MYYSSISAINIDQYIRADTSILETAFCILSPFQYVISLFRRVVFYIRKGAIRISHANSHCIFFRIVSFDIYIKSYRNNCDRSDYIV